MVATPTGGFPPEVGRTLSAPKISTPCSTHSVQSPGGGGTSESVRWRSCDYVMFNGRREVPTGEPIKSRDFFLAVTEVRKTQRQRDSTCKKLSCWRPRSRGRVAQGMEVSRNRPRPCTDSGKGTRTSVQRTDFSHRLMSLELLLRASRWEPSQRHRDFRLLGSGQETRLTEPAGLLADTWAFF